MQRRVKLCRRNWDVHTANHAPVNRDSRWRKRSFWSKASSVAVFDLFYFPPNTNINSIEKSWLMNSALNRFSLMDSNRKWKFSVATTTTIITMMRVRAVWRDNCRGAQLSNWVMNRLRGTASLWSININQLRLSTNKSSLVAFNVDRLLEKDFI